MSERIMGAVTLGGSERLVPRNASGHDRTSGSVATSGEMTQIHNRSGRARLPGPRPWFSLMTRALKFLGGVLLFALAMVTIYGWMVIGWAVTG